MSTDSEIDYEQLASATEAYREVINALVQGLVSDGFTDREARIITAGMFASKIEDMKEED